MKKLIFIIQILFVIGFYNSCSVLDDSPCGVYETYNYYRIGKEIFDTTGGVFYTYLDGNTRIFQYSELIEHICPEEHIKSKFTVKFLDDTITSVSVRANISWHSLYQDDIVMKKNAYIFEGSGETGLQQAFGKEPAWCVPTLEIYF
ncbi:MAG TPA: hypothetical protein VK590_09310, partial [Saprospiraceae bacterium]|nr:hypothetical protein [Saprospiraceae bacterium]